jgi:hypothetical protein
MSPLSSNFNRTLPTEIDLNGPTLKFTQHPLTQKVNSGLSVSFTVTVSKTFIDIPSPIDNGTLVYQWYEVPEDTQVTVKTVTDNPNLGTTAEYSKSGIKLQNTLDAKITGVTTPTLTISDLRTPEDSQRRFYCQVEYEKGTRSPKSVNGPINSMPATINVTPTLSVTSGATSGFFQDLTVRKGVFGSLSVTATVSDIRVPFNASYQWQYGNTKLEDGTTTTYETEITWKDNTQTYNIDKRFDSDDEILIPSTGTNITLEIAGASGGRGGDDGGGPGGNGGGGIAGVFTMPNRSSDTLLKFRLGSQGGGGYQSNWRSWFDTYGRPGESAIAPGGRGGNAGANGWSGGGGGGGGASGILQDGTPGVTDGRLLMVAAGGGGGGGGSHKRGGFTGFNANVFFNYGSNTIFTGSGGQGSDKSGDGGGGGGTGGGGVPPAGGIGVPGGFAGQDKAYGGGSGGGGNTNYLGDFITLSQESFHYGNGYGRATFTYTTGGPYKEEKIIPQNLTLKGTKTSTLQVKADYNHTQYAKCVVSSNEVSNSPVTSNNSSITITEPTQNSEMDIETYAPGEFYNRGIYDMSQTYNSFIQFQCTSESTPGTIVMFTPIGPALKKVLYEFEFWGGKGRNAGRSGEGGKGGYAKFQVPLDFGHTYTVAGLEPQINTLFLYEGAELIACVGEGGDAGFNYRGGRGGGIGMSGTPGSGRDAGLGGIRPTSLSLEGVFGSRYVVDGAISGIYDEDSFAEAYKGGTIIKCTKGVWERTDGQSTACFDNGRSGNRTSTTQFRESDGNIVDISQKYFRGYKPGYNIIQTAGGQYINSQARQAFLPNGGNGATGGDAPNGNADSGAGGGSGYIAKNEINIVETSTGGSDEDLCKMRIRLVS